MQAGQCSRTYEGHRGEQGDISSLKESYLGGGHNAQRVENDALPIGAAWADAWHRAWHRGGAQETFLESMREEWFVPLFIFGSGSQGRHSREKMALDLGW